MNRNELIDFLEKNDKLLADKVKRFSTLKESYKYICSDKLVFLMYIISYKSLYKKGSMLCLCEIAKFAIDKCSHNTPKMIFNFIQDCCLGLKKIDSINELDTVIVENDGRSISIKIDYRSMSLYEVKSCEMLEFFYRTIRYFSSDDSDNCYVSALLAEDTTRKTIGIFPAYCDGREYYTKIEEKINEYLQTIEI